MSAPVAPPWEPVGRRLYGTGLGPTRLSRILESRGYQVSPQQIANRAYKAKWPRGERAPVRKSLRYAGMSPEQVQEAIEERQHQEMAAVMRRCATPGCSAQYRASEPFCPSCHGQPTSGALFWTSGARCVAELRHWDRLRRVSRGEIGESNGRK